MKKLAFALAVGFLLFLGCDTREFYTVLITNESKSSKTVSYEYDGHLDELTPNQSKTYQVKAYTPPPKNITDQNGIASLEMNRKGDDFTFIDAIPFNLNVINRLPIDIIIKADNYIDNKGLIELTIVSNDESTGAKIYTKNPKFTSTTDYPIIVEYTVVKDEMSVIIR